MWGEVVGKLKLLIGMSLIVGRNNTKYVHCKFIFLTGDRSNRQVLLFNLPVTSLYAPDLSLLCVHVLILQVSAPSILPSVVHTPEVMLDQFSAQFIFITPRKYRIAY